MSRERLDHSQNLLKYKMDPQKFHNKNNCWSDECQQLPGNNRNVNPKQKQMDLEHVLQNRNMARGRYPDVNPVNVSKFKETPNVNCNRMGLNEWSRHSHPAMMYRAPAINRFHPLPRDPQRPIFWNFEKNTHLECIDNYVPEYTR